MFGLLLKDFKNVTASMRFYLVLLVVLLAFSVVFKNIYFYAGAITFFSIALPISAIAYDEKDQWDKFALAAGITRKQLIGARYVMSLVTYLPLWAIGFFFLFLPNLNGIEILYVLFYYGGMAFLTAALILPLVFAYGVERARAYYTVMVILVVVLGVFVAFWLGEGNGVLLLSVFGGFMGTSVLAFACSFAVSLRIYAKKDF